MQYSPNTFRCHTPDRGSHEETLKGEKESGEGSVEVTTGVTMIASYISNALVLWKIATVVALLWRKISKFPSSGFEPFSSALSYRRDSNNHIFLGLESTIPN
jgi:hypothetical protein